ncbi:hypothetical protein BC628DRAFT_115586 [Trametes gibbosa]|nr:hypothetical protein BC628DRAFT_609320 [Trametes gibbosa]KAI0828353.1 hypothetical protein BC628DRAFT_115586 [Trametes gibbosa]
MQAKHSSPALIQLLCPFQRNTRPHFIRFNILRCTRNHRHAFPPRRTPRTPAQRSNRYILAILTCPAARSHHSTGLANGSSVRYDLFHMDAHHAYTGVSPSEGQVTPVMSNYCQAPYASKFPRRGWDGIPVNNHIQPHRLHTIHDDTIEVLSDHDDNITASVPGYIQPELRT